MSMSVCMYVCMYVLVHLLCVLVHLPCVLAREYLCASVCDVCEFVTCVCFVIGDAGETLTLTLTLTHVTIPDNEVGDAGAKTLSSLSQLTNLDLSGEC